MDNNTAHDHTSTATTLGGLAIAAGLFIALIALGEKMRTGLIAGALLTAVGIVLLMAGKKQKKQ
jgi:drug/metabolite transporter (DMT)-like permease